MDQCPGKKIHKEESADAGTWAGPECQCKRCTPHDGNLSAANAGDESKSSIQQIVIKSELFFAKPVDFM